MFLRVETLKGDSTDPDHKDWSEVAGYQHAMRVPASSVGGGGGIVRPEHDDLVVLKFTDKSSAALSSVAAEGQVIRDVELDVCRTGLDRGLECFLRIKLTSARATSYSQSADLLERLSFDYQSIEWTYQPFSSGSKGGQALVGSWNVAKKEWSGGGGSPLKADAIGYGQGDGASFLEIRNEDISGEASFAKTSGWIGLSGFTRTLSGSGAPRATGMTSETQTIKGTDIATLKLIQSLHEGTSHDITLRFGCGRDGKEETCSNTTEIKKAVVGEVTYGASQVERVEWLEPASGGKV